MIEAKEFLDGALEMGFRAWSGVPCSFLTPFINYIIQSQDLTYIGAASEGEAVGIAAGARLAGTKSVVMFQNSGMGNTVNPLTSLNYTFRIPSLLIATHRAEPGIPDEPQHELMGQITEQLFDTMRIPWEVFPSESGEISGVMEKADKSMQETGLPFGLIMKKGAVKDFPLKAQQIRRFDVAQPVQGQFQRSQVERFARIEAIREVRDFCADRYPVVATTGKIGRELFTLGHKANQLYMVGSMGCAAAIGLGIHENWKKRDRVVVLDGDGAVLMKMGTLATIGYHQPKRLVHIILDNEVHESTGAQATVSSGIDFAGIAANTGYRNLFRSDDPSQLGSLLGQAERCPGPSLIHMKVGIQTDARLGRPTLTPIQVKEQFTEWLGN